MEADRESADERADRIAGENDAALTVVERKAIMSLHRLAKRWPKTLMLVSMGGTLHVIRAGDPLFNGGNSRSVRAQAVIQTITGIPNDGGDW